MHFDEEMGFQYLGPGITVLSPSDPRPPTVGGKRSVGSKMVQGDCRKERITDRELCR